MNRTLRFAVLGMVLALLAGIGIFICHQDQKQMTPPSKIPIGPSVQPTPPAPLLPPAPPHPQEPESSLGFHTGERLFYEFRMADDIRLSPPHPNPSNTNEVQYGAVDIHIIKSGNLIVDIYAPFALGDRRGWLVGFRLDNVLIQKSLVGSALNDPSDKVMADQLMSSEILAQIFSSGEVHAMTLSGSLSPEARVIWKEVFSRWQVVLSRTPNENVWEHEESDVTGTYLARYARKTSSYPQDIEKRKVLYLSISTQQNERAEIAMDLPQGTVIIKLNPYQVFIRGQESSSFHGFEGAAVKSQAEFSFVFTHGSQPDDLLNGAPQAEERMTRAPSFELLPPTHQSKPKSPEEVSVILRNLQSIVSSKEEAHGGGHVKGAAELIDAVEQDPAAISQIMEMLKIGDPSPEYSATLVGVLGSAGTPEAQGALLDIISSDAWPEFMRMQAIQSLVQASQPIGGAEDELMSLSERNPVYSNSADLVVAAIGDRVRDGDPARYDAISGYILEKYGSAIGDDVSQKIHALGVIENLGPKEVPEIVIHALGESDDSVSRQAVESLRRIHTEEADGLLMKAAGSSSESTRSAAARILGESARAGGTEVLTDMVANDTSESVRLSAVAGLGNLQDIESNEKVQRVLRQASEADSSADVRQAAQELLTSWHTDTDTVPK